jgi:hypothetical protein
MGRRSGSCRTKAMLFMGQDTSPPGKGLSSPTPNVVWALFNLLVGHILFRLGKVSSGGDPALLSFFTGIVVISIGLSLRFAHKNPK